MEQPTSTKQMSSPSSCSTPTKEGRTYKREVAVGLLVFWAGMVVWTMLVMNTSVLGIITAPIFLFAGGAFTMDWTAKQTNLTGDKK